MAERVRDQGLSPVECDIPDRWSIEEYRRALAIAATTREGRPRRLRLPLAGARN